MITFKSKSERVVHAGKCLGKLIERPHLVEDGGNGLLVRFKLRPCGVKGMVLFDGEVVVIDGKEVDMFEVDAASVRTKTRTAILQ